jgi:hypothetical protein
MSGGNGPGFEHKQQMDGTSPRRAGVGAWRDSFQKELMQCKPGAKRLLMGRVFKLAEQESGDDGHAVVIYLCCSMVNTSVCRPFQAI